MVMVQPIQWIVCVCVCEILVRCCYTPKRFDLVFGARVTIEFTLTFLLDKNLHPSTKAEPPLEMRCWTSGKAYV